MKSFEECCIRWLDGSLPVEEMKAFEIELQTLGVDLVGFRRQQEELVGAIAQCPAPPPMDNEVFFTESILTQIQTREPRLQSMRRSWWTLPRLAWAGVFLLLLTGVLFTQMIPWRAGVHTAPGIVSIRPVDPSISATGFSIAQQDAMVLWLDGLDYLPAEHRLR